MFVVVVLYCVQLLSEETFFNVNYDPSAIIDYIGCLTNTRLKKTASKQFFNWVARDQP